MKRGRSPHGRRPSNEPQGPTTARVDHVASGGDGVIVGPRGPTSVAGAFPGDLVRVERARGERGAHVKLLEVVEAGPERRTPACEVAGICGGCPWMAWDYPHQAAHKRGLVARALGREVELVGEDDLGYRRRATLSFRQGGLFGFLETRTDRLVDRRECVVLVPSLQAALVAIRARLGGLRGRGELALARSHDGAVATIRTADAQPAAVYEACAQLVNEGALVGLALAIEGLAPAVFGDPTERTLGADGIELVGTAGGFSQAHDRKNDLLVRAVAELAEPAGKRVLELHAGHGNLGVLLAPDAASYVGVELDRAAVDALRANLERRGLAGKSVCEDAAKYPKGSYDVVVLDPPRRGAPDVVERLAREKPAAVVYVSCAPTALQRDLQPLRDVGYAIDRAVAFDLFPQTPHVETVVRLIRA